MATRKGARRTVKPGAKRPVVRNAAARKIAGKKAAARRPGSRKIATKKIAIRKAAKTVPHAQAELRRAGQTLHDEVGPLLTAAGLGLQLLRMDYPDAEDQVNKLLGTLDRAMDRIRALSQELSPSPFLVSPRPPSASDTRRSRP